MIKQIVEADAEAKAFDEENQKIFPVSSKTGCKNALKKMIGEGTFSTKPFVER